MEEPPSARIRSLSFAARIQFNFFGNVHSRALCLGDIDNDGDIEFIAGNLDGGLSIFKGLAQDPWRRYSNLGTITSIAVGDVWNIGKNSLVVGAAEGRAYVFDFPTDKANEPATRSILPVPLNVSCILVADINKDGRNELVVGCTDRGVYAFALDATAGDHHAKLATSAGDDSNDVTSRTASAEVNQTTLLTRTWSLSQPLSIEMPLAGEGAKGLGPDDARPPTNTSESSHQMRCVLSLAAPSQVHGICARKDAEGRQRLVIGQPSASFIELTAEGATDKAATLKDPRAAHAEESMFVSDVCAGLRGPSQELNEEFLAVCAMDGKLRLYRGPDMLWERSLDRQLFLVNKMDVTGDGADERVRWLSYWADVSHPYQIIVCTVDGMTYIVDMDQNIVAFQNEDPIAAFCAGPYTCAPGSKPTPCLFYVPYNKPACVYPEITLPSLTVSTLAAHLPGLDLSAKQVAELLYGAQAAA